LKRAGLIPFIRTNVPPLLSTYSSGNKLWGISKNPWSIARTPGGSSGG
jgi:Asp-tRNA(Asn)/Glu-tRNA(Gln) amidotransferase A subunit family amidase